MVTFKKIKQTVTGKLLVEGECTSTDSKPIDIIANGSKLFEIDTGSRYFFDEGAQSWVKSVRGGAGNITVDDLDVTENGVYTPEDEQHAFGTVTVDVPPPEGYISPNGYHNYDLISVQQTGSAKQFADANRNYMIHIISNASALFGPLSAEEVYAMLEAGATINLQLDTGGSSGIIAGYVYKQDANEPFHIYFHGTQFTDSDPVTLASSFVIECVVSDSNISIIRAFLYQDGMGAVDASAMLASIDTAVNITVPYLDGRGLPRYIKTYSDRQEVEYNYESQAIGTGTAYTSYLMNIDGVTIMATDDCPEGRIFSYWSTADGTRVDDIRDLIGTQYTYSEAQPLVLHAIYSEVEEP